MCGKVKISVAVLFISLLAGASVFALDPPEITPLKLNAPATRTFQDGERHYYSVTARAGEFVEITCVKNGVDIELNFYAPNGAKILTSNSPDGFAGKETLIFAAETAGAYKIEIGSRRPGNLHGFYTLTLTDERQPEETDAGRTQAMKLAGEARDIMRGSENRVEKADRAIEKLDRAIALFERARDLQNQVNAIFFKGWLVGNEYGTEKKAVEIYESALEIWNKIDDDAGKAVCLTRAAHELRSDGKSEKSLLYFQEALALEKNLADETDQAVTLSYLCNLYNDTGNFQKGFEACRESLRINHNANPFNDYDTYSTLAALYENTGDIPNALKNTQISLERITLVKEYLNPIRFAATQSSLAAIFKDQKNYADSLRLYEAALAISEAVKRPVYAASYLNELGGIYYELGDYAKSLEYSEKSLALFRQVSPRRRQVALNVVGESYAALGRLDEARTAFAEALTMVRQNKDPYAEAATLYNLARIEISAADFETARADIEQSISISEVIRAALFGKNQRSSYLSILKRYYELKIEVLLRLDEKNPAAGYLEQAWQTHEKNRARSLLENFLESGFDYNGSAPKTFFERQKVSLEAISDAEMKSAEAVKLKNAGVQKTADANLQKSLDDYQLLQEELRRFNPQFSAVNSPPEFKFADAQKLLDDDTLLLEYALGDRQSHAWLIGKHSVKLVKLPPRETINKTARDLYLALTDRTAGGSDKKIAAQADLLSRQILPDFDKNFAGVRRIVVITDGSLQLIPFSVLTPSSGKEYEPLAKNIEIVHAPSFSSLFYLHENKFKRQNSPDKLLAVFADPIFQDDDERFGTRSKIKSKTTANPTAPTDSLSQTLRDFGVEKLARLPFTRIEAGEIAEYAPQKTILSLGANASREKFLRGDFASYQILHFATHGFLNQQNPDLSGLVLSLYDEKRQPQNGFLRVIDLYSLHLNADLVVLSACQTGLGKDVDGEGIVGLTRGFMYAGASSVVSSLWKVEDAATAELMKRFYRAMIIDRQTPSAALRTAQNEMRRIPRFSNPQNWAGFTLSGEWR